MIKAEVIIDNAEWKKKITNITKLFNGILKNLPKKYILKNIKQIKTIEFDHNDVVRHPLVSKIIRAYQKKSTEQ